MQNQDDASNLQSEPVNNGGGENSNAKASESTGFDCQSCERPNSDDDMVLCDTCNLWFHYRCANVNDSVKDREWKCATCAVKSKNRSPLSKAGSTASSKSRRAAASLRLLEEQRQHLEALEMAQQVQLERERMFLVNKRERIQRYNEEKKQIIINLSDTDDDEFEETNNEVVEKNKQAGLDGLAQFVPNSASWWNSDVCGPSSHNKNSPAPSTSVQALKQTQNELELIPSLTIASVTREQLRYSNAIYTSTSSYPTDVVNVQPNTGKMNVISHDANHPSGIDSITASVSKIRFSEPQLKVYQPNEYDVPLIHMNSTNRLAQGGLTITTRSRYAPSTSANVSARTNTDGLIEDSTPNDNGNAFPGIHRSTARDANFVYPGMAQESMPGLNAQYPRVERGVAVQYPQRRMLPELISFSGNAEEWPLFISNFENSTRAWGLSHEDNLVRLQTALKADALEAVQYKMMFPTLVPDIIDTLRRQFGKPELIIFSIRDHIVKMPPIRVEKIETVIKFANAVQNLALHIALTNMPSHLYDPILMRDLVEKLPPMLKFEWAIFREQYDRLNPNSGDDVPDLSVFCLWIQQLEKALDRVYTPPIRKSTATSTSFGKSNSRSPKLYVNTHVDPNELDKRQPLRKCRICNGDCLGLKQCEIFLAYNVAKRIIKVKECKACINCLRYHGRFRCSKGSCGVHGCQQRHHALLHEDKKPPSPTTTATVTVHEATERTILFRVIPVNIYGRDVTISTYAFFDEGSSVTLVDSTLADELNLDGELKPISIKWTDDTCRTESDSKKVCFEISGSNGKRFTINDARTMKRLNLPTQSVNVKEISRRYQYLKDIPLESYTKGVPKILIGLDNWNLAFPRKCIYGSRNEPMAAKTPLGWCLFGPYLSAPLQKVEETEQVYHVCECDQSEDDLNQIVRNYIMIDSLATTPLKSKLLSDDDKRALKIMEETTTCQENRYTTGLLWRYEVNHLPDSKAMALKRLECLERRMLKDEALSADLHNKIREYEHKGYARKITTEEINKALRVWYLPIFAVSNPNKPGKTRLVWDAAAKSGGTSLNDLLLTGPDMLTSLPGVLHRFREHAVGICGDIRQMFHQIKIRDEDQHSQRFLWRTDPNRPPDVYVMNVMTFGARCSPSCAQFVKNRNAERFRAQYPRAVETIVNGHYVDDLLDSVDSKEDAVQLGKQVKLIHEQGGFEIHNWLSNSDQVTAALTDVKSDEHLNMDITKDTEKVLGMWWDTSQDTFTFRLSTNPKFTTILNGHKPTKREILRVVMMVFDPLGLISYFTIYAKILLQQMWREKYDWDDRVQDHIWAKWQLWVSLLPKIEKINIPRYYLKDASNNDYSNTQLHIMVDASEGAYAAVGYLRSCNDDVVVVKLLSSKAKVAPLKIRGIPRLELEAALLGSRLADNLRTQHKIQFSTCFFWTDSITVLRWLRSPERRYKQFVAVRVAEILELTVVENWRYVPTDLNVSDDATKWVKPPNLSSNDRWFTGPKFLYDVENLWPINIVAEDVLDDELRPINHHTITQVEMVNVKNFSSWCRLVRVIAKAKRYVRNLYLTINDLPRKTGHTTQMEYLAAENFLFKQEQSIGYSEEIGILIRNKKRGTDERFESIPQSSPVYKLSPYIDDDDIMRAWGRIDHAQNAPYDLRHPILLPRHGALAKLIVGHYHRVYLHAVNETVITEVRKRYHIPHLRQLLKSVAYNCAVCKIRKAKPIQPQMADLPPARLATYVRPFTYSGIDYFGPMTVVIGRRVEKRWGVLITCLNIRAIHIEIAHSLSTDSCIMCLKSFMARRGVPRQIFSDNATNFKGASEELIRTVKQIDRNRLLDTFVTSTTSWSFIPPASPNMGGAWERLVRSVKNALHEIHPLKTPTDEMLKTMLAEVEDMVNSRPLTHVPVDDELSQPMTPNDFLKGPYENNLRKPFEDEVNLKQNWQIIQEYMNRLWKRWIQEYFPTLTRRGKWIEKSTPLQVGDIVIVVDPSSPKNSWPKGKIVKVYAAKDGQTRFADVMTTTGVYKRPTSKLAIIDLRSKCDRANEVTGRENVTNAN